MGKQEGLKKRGLNAVKWSFLEKLLKRGVSFVVSMFLARLLEPSDFGLIAMVGFFTAFAGSFSDLGFGQALVQKKNITYLQYSTVFYINIFLGILIFLLLYIAAPYISRFYKEDIIILLVRVSALSFIISSFAVVNGAILFSELKLKVFTYAMVLSSSLSGAIGVYMAYHGYGVWSLVGYGLSGNLIRVIVLWFATDWKPQFVFSLQSIKDIWKTGLSFLNIGIINNVLQSLDSLIIGKIFTVSSLGFYNRAKSLQELPLYTFIVPITRPFFPLFSEVQDNQEKQKEMFYSTVEMLNFIVVLGFGLMFALAQNWIVILYSDKWLPSVPFFKALILLIPMAPFNLLSTSLFKGTGKLKLLTIITVIDRLMILPAMVFGLYYDILTFLYVFVGLKIAVSIFRLFFVQKYLSINALKMVWSLMKMMIIFILILIPLQYFVTIQDIYIETVVKSLLFLTLYVSVNYLLGMEGFNMLRKEISNYLKLNK